MACDHREGFEPARQPSERFVPFDASTECVGGNNMPAILELFGAASTTNDVLTGINLSGKRILVTGVSAGLGIETARSLATHGAHVVGAARDLNKAKTATEQVRNDAEANGGSFEIVALDLANLASVRG